MKDVNFESLEALILLKQVSLVATANLKVDNLDSDF